MYSVVGICVLLAAAFGIIMICFETIKMFYNINDGINIATTILLVTLIFTAFVFGIKYSCEDPQNWSAKQKLEYIESGKEIPKERDKKLDEDFIRGWKIGAVASTGVLVSFGIVTFGLTRSKKYKREKYKDRLNNKRNQLERLKWDTSGKRREIVESAINTVDKVLKNLEWQEQLESVKDSLSIIEDIKRDDSWKDLQAEIDKLEAFIELSKAE